jgi:hypothetical protein
LNVCGVICRDVHRLLDGLETVVPDFEAMLARPDFHRPWRHADGLTVDEHRCSARFTHDRYLLHAFGGEPRFERLDEQFHRRTILRVGRAP